MTKFAEHNFPAKRSLRRFADNHPAAMHICIAPTRSMDNGNHAAAADPP